MACLKYLAASIVLVATGANAGFAQVSPPVNWSESAGKFFYKAAANDTVFTGGLRGAAGVVNVGGRSVVMPAAYRFASNAAVLASRSAFLNPGIFAAVIVGSALWQYYENNQLKVENDVWLTSNREITEILVYAGGVIVPNFPALVSFCKAQDIKNPWPCPVSYQTRNGVKYKSVHSFPPGDNSLGSVGYWRVTEVIKDDWIPISQQDFEEKLSPQPIPKGLPFLIPDPLPVEAPLLNPSPGLNPQSKPLRVPQGLPQLIPGSDPAQWKTPTIDIVPSPAPDNPWRVDIQPKDLIKDSPTPLPDSEPVPESPPEGQEEQEKDPDLCEKNPDILACQKPDFEIPDADDLETLDKSVTITPDSGWGGGGSCPAPRHLTGANIDIPFTQYCDFMTGIRPVVLAIAWLSAAFILIGARQSSTS